MTDIQVGQVLWEPSAERIAEANITRFTGWLNKRFGLAINSYHDLWMWSVNEHEVFWSAIYEYFSVAPAAPAEPVLATQEMPGAQWFPEAKLNFAEHLLRGGSSVEVNDDKVAVYFESELYEARQLSWAELRQEVVYLATYLRSQGIGPGDRVCGYLPTTPEALVAMLASAAVGAIWSCCSPDFGSKSVLERFAQTQPKALIAVDGYRFGGKDYNRRDDVQAIRDALPSLETFIYLPSLETHPLPAGAVSWVSVARGPEDASPQAVYQSFAFEQLPFDHPLWILYTSGTTGSPKGIVHGHGGILLEFLKAACLQDDLKPDSVKFFYTSTGWTMFNLLIGGLVSGCAIVLYDGSPTFPDEKRLWSLAEKYSVNYFGANPAFVQLLQHEGLRPKDHFDLSSIDTVALTGSPATVETFDWFYQNVHKDLFVLSMSGGTDVAAAFVGGVPVLPVWAGEIQSPSLGVAVCAYDAAGKAVLNEEGELVVTKPIPSMPLFLWGDTENVRYRDSYFDTYPDVWRQGDLIRFTDRGSCIISGRSDATLNRKGIRIGTAEIYRCVEAIAGIKDSLVVDVSTGGVDSFMPLFLVLDQGIELDSILRERIVKGLREQCSPRHVPDTMLIAPAIPYTLSGKKLEVPVKRLLMGQDPRKALNLGAVAQPQSLNYFIELAASDWLSQVS